MSNGYSIELRSRAMAFYKSGRTQHEVCAAFEIGLRTLGRWIKLQRDTGSFALKKRPSVRSSRKLTPEDLEAYFAKNPDHFLREASEHFKVNASAIDRACCKFGITRKKNAPISGAMRRKKASISAGGSKDISR